MARIIIADDNTLSRELLSKYLNSLDEKLGVEEADDYEGVTGRLMKRKYSLILINGQKNKLDYSKLIGEIRKIDQKVMIYVYSSIDSEEEVINAGATGCINKAEGINKLEQILGNSIK